MDKDLLITDTNIITMKEDRILPSRDILLSGGKIKKIAPRGQIPGENRQIIPGRGRFLLPGFSDMHTHLTGDKKELFFFLAAGVTTIRNMSGIQLPPLLRKLPGLGFLKHLSIKQEIAEGRIMGPELFNGTPLIDGSPPIFPWPISRKITDPGKVPEMVRRYKQQGYDFLKVYNNLGPEVFEAIMKQARAREMKVAGHIPYSTGIEKAINLGIYSVEHLLGYISPFKPGINEVLPEEIERIVILTREKNVWNCPTLINWDRWKDYPRFRKFKNLDYLKYLSPRVLGMYIRRCLFYERASPDQVRRFSIKNHKAFAPLVKLLWEKKALMVTGTDSSNPFVVPGFSLHEEFQLLADAGLPAKEVLKMTTINAARLLGREKETGTVEEGKNADLVLLEKSPLEDIRHTRSITGVVRRGRWLGAGEIHNTLTRWARKYENGNRKYFKILNS